MIETAFEYSYPAAKRISAVRAAAIVALYGLPKNVRCDLEQEGLLELWQKRQAYDARRSCWRTFSEAIVTNKISSLVRRMCSQRSGLLREDPLERAVGLAAPNDHVDLRTDVARVLAGVSQFDRKVAFHLINHSAIETGQRLGISRATVYRSIGRLRVAFTTAGLTISRDSRGRGVC